MKLSNKLLIGFFSLVFILTLYTMIKIQHLEKEYFKNRITGNKNWITHEIPLKDFTSLEAGGHFIVRWHKGSPMLKVKIEETLKPFFNFHQSADKTSFDMDSLGSYTSNGSIEVDVYSENLINLNLNGFIQFSSMDTLNNPVLKIELEDHAEVELLIHADSLNLNMYDFCSLQIKGQSHATNLKLSDHSQLEAYEFYITNAYCQMDDFSGAELQVVKYLKAECQDHANLSYKGENVIAESSQRNFSQVNKEE